MKLKNREFIELLSPARNLECGLAAIDHGADAVYIGASRFGARAAAGNTTEDIRALCNYAHRFGAKVYVAINTLLRDEEREPARRLAWDVYRAGADALIIQDPIFLHLAMPPIPLHASTQMDNRSLLHCKKLKELGFKQIVLARELSLEEIRSIHEAIPDVAIEAFVHGALCVSYSGRCYASEYCFGRSANRGECAQFCRLPFSLEDGSGRTLVRDKYLLSLRDMNRISELEAMLDAGVRSFKIEGRLKDVGYVKNVTAAYRQALDAILTRRPEFVRSSFGSSTYTFRPDLSRSFSRGNTNYFLRGRTDDLASPDTPKSRGREVGRVKEVRRDCIIVASAEKFSNGDGLCYFDEDGRLQGFRINRAEGNHLYFNSSLINAKLKENSNTEAYGLNIRKGDRLWRSYDQEWERLMSGRTAERRMACRFVLEETEQGFRLCFAAENGAEACLGYTLEHQLARTDQADSIREVLGKLGDTPYRCNDVEVHFTQPWFIPRSILADWRREVIAKSDEVNSEKLQTKNESIYNSIKSNTDSSPQSNLDFSPSAYHFSLEDISREEPSPLMTCRFCLRHAWGQCLKEKGRKSEWQEPLHLVLGDGRRFRLCFDCKKCQMTVSAAK